MLLAIEEIKALKARYFRCMDTKDWDGFAALFTIDASLDVSGEMRAGHGATASCGAAATSLRSCGTRSTP